MSEVYEEDGMDLDDEGDFDEQVQRHEMEMAMDAMNQGQFDQQAFDEAKERERKHIERMQKGRTQRIEKGGWNTKDYTDSSLLKDKPMTTKKKKDKGLDFTI